MADEVCPAFLNYNQTMLSVVIQAGGESRRMGRDKGLAYFLGERLIERAVRRVRSLADEILVTTNKEEDYRFLGLPLFPDLQPGSGALGGLYTALHAAGLPLVAVVACDMPFINAELLAAARDLLVHTGADLVIARMPEGYEPFHALYRRQTCLPAVQRALQAGERKMISWFPQVTVREIPGETIAALDPNGLAFLNLNTPEELRQAENLARSIGEGVAGPQNPDDLPGSRSSD